MRFIPRTTRWSRFTYMRPSYRYSILGILIVLIIGWRYGLYMWLDALITEKQIVLYQLEHHYGEQLRNQRYHDALLEQIPTLKKLCMQEAAYSVGASAQEQCSYIFGQVQKAGVTLVGYRAEKEKKHHDRYMKYMSTIMVKGTLDQIMVLLRSLAKSERLIQCTSLSLQHQESKIYRAECTVQYIVYKI